ncbi:hypothetical protein [Streptomyces sp. LaBMicrA B280]|uniref:hypothetical protein n=1 Tax=Streptomyces sp. LaBMicrA B280 TaxID=3391001 RepID=UPI003BA6C612
MGMDRLGRDAFQRGHGELGVVAGCVDARDFIGAAEQMLLRAFYTYALPEGGAYDLIAELHAGRRADTDVSRWRVAKAHLLARP